MSVEQEKMQQQTEGNYCLQVRVARNGHVQSCLAAMRMFIHLVASSDSLCHTDGASKASGDGVQVAISEVLSERA